MEHDLMGMLDRLEDLIDDATHVPFTGRVVVNVDQAYDLIDQLRKSIPENMRQAQRVIQDRDRIVAQAREQAEAIVQEAQAYAERLARESNIMQRAQEEAARVMEEARRQSREIKLGARDYAAEMLQRLEDNLEKCLVVVRAGMDEVRMEKPVNDGVAVTGDLEIREGGSERRRLRMAAGD